MGKQLKTAGVWTRKRKNAIADLAYAGSELIRATVLCISRKACAFVQKLFCPLVKLFHPGDEPMELARSGVFPCDSCSLKLEDSTSPSAALLGYFECRRRFYCAASPDQLFQDPVLMTLSFSPQQKTSTVPSRRISYDARKQTEAKNKDKIHGMGSRLDALSDGKSTRKRRGHISVSQILRTQDPGDGS